MKRLLGSILFIMLATNVAHAGLLDDLRDNLPKSMKAKEMVRVELPLKAIKKNDPRIKQLETLAIQVVMKHKWKLQIACPNDHYCKKIKKDMDAEAWRIARSKVNNDYAAKAKQPKIQMIQARNYQLVLMRKGF